MRQRTVAAVALAALAAGGLLHLAGEASAGDGEAVVDESSLTGEPLPVAIARGRSVRSGTANAGDVFELRAIRPAALALADVGIALGAGGATVSSETADAVIVVDRVDRVAEAIRIGRR